MSIHTATVTWQRSADSKFTDNGYSRAHAWHFDGGVTVPASSSPHAVRVPFSDPANVDPEEAYVAALSSCHMLWFLSIAASAGYVVDAYEDRAQGVMAKNEAGRQVVTTVTLKPHVIFSGSKAPTDAVLDELHHKAHEECFLANSVRTTIEVDGSWAYAGA